MATQQTYYSVTTTRATTSSTSDVVFGSLTFTPDANSDYLLIHRATIDVNATGSDVRYNLYNGTSNIALSNIEPADATDRKPVGGIALESFGSSPSSMTYDGRYSAEVGTTTAGMADFRAVAIKMGADDEYAESLGLSSTTSDSAQVKTTLTFTPATTGDYIIISSAEVRMSTVNSAMFVQVNLDSGTILDNSYYRPKDSTNYRTWSGIKRVNLSNASHTFTIEYARNIASGTAYIRNARIVAIRADRFEANYYAEQLTEQSYTGTTYTDVLTLTDTPEAVNHLIIGSTQFGGAGTTLNVFNKLIEDSTDDVEVQEEPFKTENRLSFLTFYEKTLAASSTTWKIQHKYEGAATARTDEAAILVLQLEAASTGTDSTLASTEENDTLSSAAAVKLTASLASTEADDTLSSSAKVAIAASLAATETDDTLSSSATVATVTDSTLNATEDEDTLAAAAAVKLSGTLSSTDADDTLSASTAVQVSTSLAATEADDTLSSAVQVGIASSLASTEDDDTLSSNTAVAVASSLASTEADDALSASAAVEIDASLSATEDDDTLAAALFGTESSNSTVSVTEDDDTLGAEASVTGVANDNGGLSGGFHEGKRKNNKLGYEESIGTKYDGLIPEQPVEQVKKKQAKPTEKTTLKLNTPVKIAEIDYQTVLNKRRDKIKLLESIEELNDNYYETLRYIQNEEEEMLLMMAAII